MEPVFLGVGNDPDCMIVDDDGIMVPLSTTTSSGPLMPNPTADEEEVGNNDDDLPPSKRPKLVSQTASSESISSSSTVPLMLQPQRSVGLGYSHWPLKIRFNNKTPPRSQQISTASSMSLPTTTGSATTMSLKETKPEFSFTSTIHRPSSSNNTMKAGGADFKTGVTPAAKQNTKKNHIGKPVSNSSSSDDMSDDDTGDEDDVQVTSSLSTTAMQNLKKRKRSTGPKSRSRQTKYMFSAYQLKNLSKHIETIEKRMQNLPLAPQPEWITTPLLPHQLQAMHWFADKKCAILGDEMGLGKTIQTLSILSIQYAKQHKIAHEQQSHHHNQQQQPHYPAKIILPPSLVVCPKSTISNWMQEAKQHVDNSKMVAIAYTNDKTLHSYLQYRDPRVRILHSFICDSVS